MKTDTHKTTLYLHKGLYERTRRLAFEHRVTITGVVEVALVFLFLELRKRDPERQKGVIALRDLRDDAMISQEEEAPRRGKRRKKRKP
jgi:hypothetical protein